MSKAENHLNIEDKSLNRKKGKYSFNNLKRIRKDLMTLAKDEILDIKKSKKDVTVENFVDQEIVAPSKYSLTTKGINLHFTKNYSNKFETVEEKITNNKYHNNGEKMKEVNKNEISSSDISEDDE